VDNLGDYFEGFEQLNGLYLYLYFVVHVVHCMP
jgi:hypothetical protein